MPFSNLNGIVCHLIYYRVLNRFKISFANILKKICLCKIIVIYLQKIINQKKLIMDVKKLLSECVVEPSTLSRTGKFYIKDGVVILENMGSNKNIWVDEDFANKFTDFKQLETEIREFFKGKVNSIIPMDINQQANEFKDMIKQIFKDNDMEFTDEKFKEALQNYRKVFKK